MSRVSIGELVAAGVLQIGDGYRTKRSEHAQHGYRIIRVADVIEGAVSFTGPDFVSEKYAKAIGTKAGKPGDILLTTKGTVGRVAVLPDTNEQVVYSPQLCFFRVLDAEVVDSAFLQYWFSSAEFWHQAADRMNNTDMAAYINLADIRSLKLTVPDISEQRFIAEVLGALDDKIAANTKVAATASQLAGLIYDSSAAHFDARPMSDVLTPVLGGTPARSRADFWSGDQLWASAKDITGAQCGVVLTTDEKITEAAVAGTKAKPLPAGSVILTARGTVGAVARLAARASLNQSCYGFVPGAIPPGVLYFAITRAVRRAKEIAHGSVFDTITMKTFDHLPFPDFDAEALTATEGEIGPLLEVVVGLVRENSSLATTRDVVLAQLMSGNLRAKNGEKVLEQAGV